jgi:hypothetical protein
MSTNMSKPKPKKSAKSKKPKLAAGRSSSRAGRATTATKPSSPASSGATQIAAPSTSANKLSEPNRGKGRPTTYIPEAGDLLLEYFTREPWVETERTITRRDGQTVTEMVRLPAELPTLAGFACVIGVHRDTLNEWQRKYPDFSDAVKKAKDQQERILVANGLCGLYEGPFGIFTAKNILGWRDKVEQELSGPNGGPIETKSDVTVSPSDSYLRMLGK